MHGTALDVSRLWRRRDFGALVTTERPIADGKTLCHFILGTDQEGCVRRPGPLHNTACIWQNRSGIVPNITALESDFEVEKD
jgi:hypothetical protein